MYFYCGVTECEAFSSHTHLAIKFSLNSGGKRELLLVFIVSIKCGCQLNRDSLGY